MRYHLLAISIFFSLNIYANEIVSQIRLHLKKEVENISVVKIKGKYYFNGRQGKERFILGRSTQEFFLPENKAKYDLKGSNIQYQIYILPTTKGLMYINSDGLQPYIPNSVGSSGNSIIMETGQQDNGNFNFYLKYDYVPKIKKIKLTAIYLYEQERTEEMPYQIYKVGIKIPKKIMYLSNYNSKEMTKFIVHRLYPRENLNLLLVDYTYSDDSYFRNVKKVSLCHNHERVKFSCQLSNSKFISVCQLNHDLIYRYGTEDNVELEKSPKWGINISKEKKSDGDYHIVDRFFNLGQYKYNINSSSYINGPNDYFQPVYALKVFHSGKEVFSKQCVAVSQYFPL